MPAVAMPSAIDKAIQSFTSQQSAIDKAMTAMAKMSAIDLTLPSFTLQQSAIDKAIAAMASPLAIEKTIRSFASQQSAIDKAMATMAKMSAIDMIVPSFALQPSVIDKALQVFTESNHFLIAEPNWLAAITESINSVDINQHISVGEQAKINVNFNESCQQLCDAEDSQSFIQILKRLPPVFQSLLIYFLINIFLSQVNSISANLLTPIVESYLSGSESPNREKIKDIKRLPQILDEVTTDSLRFITANDIRLREAPSTKSDILDEIALGQVVTVLSKNRNWIEIMYEYENGETMHGWVFARYTAKFAR